MNFTPEQNPRLQQLAKEAAAKINALQEATDAQIQDIYENFRKEYAQIKAEANADSLHRSGAGSLPNDQLNRKD